MQRGKPGTDGTFSDILGGIMARLARVIAVDVPHHVTQRGNARRFILDSDGDRQVYLELLRESILLHQLSLVGYCLMSNHVHLVVIPHRSDALALALKQTHGRYAAYWNARHGSCGHVWQGRFYSCPLDTPHLWAALRYVELNPVRAGLVAEPAAWPWSSAAAHLGQAEPALPLEMALWRQSWDADRWRAYLAAADRDADLAELRQCTHSGRPLGSAEFVKTLEQATRRRLAPQKGGRRPRRSAENQNQFVFNQ
jgi:putative transposase